MTVFGFPLSWLLFLFVYVPIVVLWAAVINNVIARKDVSGWAKFGWAILVFSFPFLGSLIYLATSPSEEKRVEQERTKRAA